MLNAKSSMPSIRKRLTVLLLISILLASSFASMTVFYFAYQEAQEFQDDTLRQIGLLNAQNTGVLHKKVGTDHEYALEVWQLNSHALPIWLNSKLTPGFHEIQNGETRYRLWVSDLQAQPRLVVAQPTAERDELALNSALRTLFPMLLLLPITLGVFIWGLNRELRSVEKLSNQIDQQLSHQVPEALPELDIPQELSHFISAINRLLARLHQAFIQQKRFTADAAHELRTPLAALSLQVQNLEHAKTVPEMHERLVPLKAGVNRSIRLTEQLLDINRMQSVALIKRPLPLAPLLRDCIGLHFPAADEKSIELSLEVDEALSVETHLEALSLIVCNALDNAIKYSASNTHISITATQDGPCWEIKIEDQGPGINEQQLQNVFEAFTRATETEVSGTGLGMAIAKSAAEQIGGKIFLMNAPSNSGLIFLYQQTINPKG